MKNPIEVYTDKRAVMPLLSWDIFSQFSLANSYTTASSKTNEIEKLSQFAFNFKWKNDIKSILETNNYEALVLTDASKKILWVNDGFTRMTGYSKDFAKNKQPVFLQGEASVEKRKVIRKKLAKDLPFKEVIINYKKDGSPYNCEVYIIPLKSNKTTHYLALERAI